MDGLKKAIGGDDAKGHSQKKKHGFIHDNNSKVSLECCKFNGAFNQLNKDAEDAIKTLKALGGIDGCMLDKLNLEEKRCVCWGTPIGDRLLQLAGHLDPGNKTLLAQTENEPLTEDDMAEIDSQTEVASTKRSKSSSSSSGGGDGEDPVDKENYPNLHSFVGKM